MADDPLTIIVGAGLATAVFIGTLYGTIWLTRRRLAPALVSSALLALAAASPPWVYRFIGGQWTFESGLIFSALMGTIVVAAAHRPFRTLYQSGGSRDIRER